MFGTMIVVTGAGFFTSSFVMEAEVFLLTVSVFGLLLPIGLLTGGFFAAVLGGVFFGVVFTDGLDVVFEGVVFAAGLFCGVDLFTVGLSRKKGST
jgi:hypothetical protein